MAQSAKKAPVVAPELAAELAPDLARTDELPIGVHLGWRLRALIQSGRLPAREQLPGVRELAAGAGVNVNTARAVYRRLELDDLAVSRQGSGTFVAPNVTVTPSLEQFAAAVAAEAIANGIEPRELARALYAGTAPRTLLPGAVEEAAEEMGESSARATLRGQIARLESQLGAYPEAGLDSPPPLFSGPTPRIPDIAELEEIRDGLVERVKKVRADADAAGERESSARARLEDAIADPGAHKRERITNEELGEPGCKWWEVRPVAGPVGALMNWWRVKVSSGCP